MATTPLPLTGPREFAASISRSKNLPWFQPEIGAKLMPAFGSCWKAIVASRPRTLKRDQAWEIFPWPCIGEFWFTSLGLSQHPSYESLLSRLGPTSSSLNPAIITPKFLDLGTCLGQDVRKLIFDGAPIAALYASDIFPEFEAAGYSLFRDEAKFPPGEHFITADIFDTSADSNLVKTQGSWDVISIFMFLHVWDLRDQKRACYRILDLLSPKAGSWIIGAQAGSVEPREFPLLPPFVREGEQKSMYLHSVETFKTMWEGIAEEAGVKLDIWVENESRVDPDQMSSGAKPLFRGTDYKRLLFLIKRL